MQPSVSSVLPISSARQTEVTDKTRYFVHQAELLYCRSFDEIPVKFDLSGRTAGMYVVRNNTRLIRYNPWLFEKYFLENLNDTVPHEVAHYVVEQMYGQGNVKPHGQEWKQLMREFGVEPRRTCNFDMSGIPTRAHRRFKYQCDCRTHSVSTRMHNTINRKQKTYLCRQCGTKLEHCNAA